MTELIWDEKYKVAQVVRPSRSFRDSNGVSETHVNSISLLEPPEVLSIPANARTFTQNEGEPVANAENLAEKRATSHLFIDYAFSKCPAALGKYGNNLIILREHI